MRDVLQPFQQSCASLVSSRVHAELHDVMDEELRRFYPELVRKHARVLLVELSVSMPHHGMHSYCGGKRALNQRS